MRTIKNKFNNLERASTIALSIFFLFSLLFVIPNETFAQTKKKCCSKTAKKKQKNDSLAACLPKDVMLIDIVSYSFDPKVKHTTVKDELIRLKAKCVGGKLIDTEGKEIRFFRPSCWGNAPANVQEIKERERKELEELKEKYTVIVFNCNPMIQ